MSKNDKTYAQYYVELSTLLSNLLYNKNWPPVGFILKTERGQYIARETTNGC